MEAMNERAEGTCARCIARDGRHVREYEDVVKRLKQTLCDECARVTEAAHKLKPAAPAAPSATPEAAEPPKKTEAAAPSAPPAKTEEG